MPRYQPNGRIAVIWCPSIADITAPTVAELTAGVKMAQYMLPDGLNIPLDFKSVDTSDAGSDFNSAEVGTWGGGTGTYTFHRDSLSGLDVPWNTLTRFAKGAWAVAPNGFGVDADGFGLEENTPVPGERLHTFPARIGLTAPVQLKRDTTNQAMTSFAVPTAPELHAVVAA